MAAAELSPHYDHVGHQGVPRFVAFLSSLLQRIAEANDAPAAARRQLGVQKATAFHGLTRPAISVESYLERIFTYANCSTSCYVVAYIYLDRLVQRQPLVAVDSYNVHRLLITSVMVSAKFMDDICYNNAYFAKVGGISTVEMNLLERDFLFGLNFRLNVTPGTFQTYCSHLHREMYLEFPAASLKYQCLFSDADVVEVNGHHQQQQKQQQQQAHQLAV